MMWWYREGGNPPEIAGIFTESRKHRGKRVAWWPAGYPPNEENVMRVVEELVQTREDENTPVSRQAIRDLLGPLN